MQQVGQFLLIEFLDNRPKPHNHLISVFVSFIESIFSPIFDVDSLGSIQNHLHFMGLKNTQALSGNHSSDAGNERFHVLINTSHAIQLNSTNIVDFTFHRCTGICFCRSLRLFFLTLPNLVSRSYYSSGF